MERGREVLAPEVFQQLDLCEMEGAAGRRECFCWWVHSGRSRIASVRAAAAPFNSS